MTAKKIHVLLVKFCVYLIKFLQCECILVATYTLRVMSELCPRGLHVEIILGRGSVGLV